MIGMLTLAVLCGQPANESRFPPALQATAREATVRVFHTATRGEGSGVVIRYEGGYAYILTAAHNVPEEGVNANEVEISFFPRGKRRDEITPIKTEVTARMPNEDLALIRMGLKQAPPAVLPLCPKIAAPPKHSATPIPALAVGIGDRGLPEAIEDKIQSHKYLKKPNGTAAFHWETELPQAIGRSGGPLLNPSGQVVGICSGTQNKKGYYVSIYEIENSLNNNSWGFLNRPAVSSDRDPKSQKMTPDGKKN